MWRDVFRHRSGARLAVEGRAWVRAGDRARRDLSRGGTCGTLGDRRGDCADRGKLLAFRWQLDVVARCAKW